MGHRTGCKRPRDGRVKLGDGLFKGWGFVAGRRESLEVATSRLPPPAMRDMEWGRPKGSRGCLGEPWYLQRGAQCQSKQAGGECSEVCIDANQGAQWEGIGGRGNKFRHVQSQIRMGS